MTSFWINFTAIKFDQSKTLTIWMKILRFLFKLGLRCRLLKASKWRISRFQQPMTIRSALLTLILPAANPHINPKCCVIKSSAQCLKIAHLVWNFLLLYKIELDPWIRCSQKRSAKQAKRSQPTIAFFSLTFHWRSSSVPPPPPPLPTLLLLFCCLSSFVTCLIHRTNYTEHPHGENIIVQQYALEVLVDIARVDWVCLALQAAAVWPRL